MRRSASRKGLGSQAGSPTPLASELQPKAATKASKADRVAMAAAEENYKYGKSVGYVLGEAEGHYLGSVPVDKPTGIPIISDARETIIRSGTPARDVTLCVSVNGLFFFDKRTRNVVGSVEVQQITFVHLDPKDTKNVAFITTNDELGLITCHCFKVPKGAQTIPLAINEAFMVQTGKIEAPDPTEKRQRKMSVSEVKKATDVLRRRSSGGEKKERRNSLSGSGKPGKGESLKRRNSFKKNTSLVGAFPCTYLFSLAAEEKAGMHVINRALDQAAEIGVPAGTGCILLVSAEGIKAVDQMSGDIRCSNVLREVTFTSVCGMRGDLVAYISMNETTSRILVHIFKTGTEDAPAVCVAFQKAFLKARQEAMNPFRPFSDAREPAPKELARRQIRRGHLEAIKPIGAGQFGMVWSAKVNEPGKKVRLAGVKMLRDSASARQKDEFVRECMAMYKLEHKNIVELFGVCVQQQPWCAVMQFVKYGDLRNIMQSCGEKGKAVPSEVLLSFCVQVASGMQCVADAGLVHLDLAARNILLGTKNVAKVADFGLANPVGGDGFFSLQPGVKLPMKWMSIEAMDTRKFSQASDVWAYGVMVWELFSYGAVPFDGIKNLELQDMVRDGLRLDEPEGMPEGVHNYCIQYLWSKLPTDRPIFADVVDKFKEIAADFPVAKGDLGKELQTFVPPVAAPSKPKRPRWHHGNVSKEEAEKSLSSASHGDFLVRRVEKGIFALMIKDKDRTKTLLIKLSEEGKYKFIEEEYDSLDAVIAQLRMKPLIGADGALKLNKTLKRRKSVANGLKRSTSRGSVKEPKKEKAPYDPLKDSAWNVGRLSKADAEAAVGKGKQGDFLVRSNKDASKHFLIIHDGPQSKTFVIKLEEGMHSLGNIREKTLEQAVAKTIGRSFPGNTEPFITVSQPARIPTGASPVAGEISPDDGFDGFAEDTPNGESNGVEDGSHAAEGTNGFDDNPSGEIDGFGSEEPGGVAGAAAPAAASADDGFEGGFGDDAGLATDVGVDPGDDGDGDDGDDENAEDSDEAAAAMMSANNAALESTIRSKSKAASDRKWFAGVMTTEETRALVEQGPTGSYLVRQNDGGDLMFVVSDASGICEVPIEKKGDSFNLGTCKNETVSQLLTQVTRSGLHNPESGKMIFPAGAAPGGTEYGE